MNLGISLITMCFSLLKSLSFLMCRCIVLSTGYPLDQLPCIFWHGPIYFWFLDFWDRKMSPNLILYLPCPRPGIGHFQRVLISFSGGLILETKIWVLGAIAPIGLMSLLSAITGRRWYVSVCVFSHVLFVDIFQFNSDSMVFSHVSWIFSFISFTLKILVYNITDVIIAISY